MRVFPNFSGGKCACYRVAVGRIRRPLEDMMTAHPAPDRPPRLGLALSGGGFRASLFHIGVLARMAELDLLRDVQVISTVSGGSIIGALYYLRVRNLLRSKPDAAITRADYVEMVDDLWRTFSAAIEHNLRMRTFADWRANLRMFHDRRYSRSDRMAELYEAYLYAAAAGVTPPARVVLPALTIQPCGESNFQPFDEDERGHTANDRRMNKVPALVINATTLNTGHNFQFTATWLGEPPQAAADIDRNLRLRRAYYHRDGLPEKYQQLPLGLAVAASAAVPGIFAPLALTDMYRDGADDLTPQLVDGGVHDNQGIAGLLDPDHPCTHLIVSDASGQMEDLHSPLTIFAAVLKRSNDTLMSRVREEEYAAAASREGQGIAALRFFHLKESLLQRELTWIGGCDKPAQVTGAGETTPYGVHPRIQVLLARIRTDLDAFSEVEAHALMADGYLISRQHLCDKLCQSLGRPAAAEQTHAWPFLDVQPYLADPDLDPSFAEQLAAGSRLFGKSLRTVPSLRWTGNPLLRGAAVTLVAVAVGLLSRFGGNVMGTVFAILGFLAAIWAVKLVAQARHWSSLETIAGWMQAIAPGIVVAPLLALAVNRHLRILTPLRLEYGKVDRLRPPPAFGVNREAA